jgi:hypothetical protein
MSRWLEAGFHAACDFRYLLARLSSGDCGPDSSCNFVVTVQQRYRQEGT